MSAPTMNAEKAVEQVIAKIKHWLGVLIGLALLIAIAGAIAKALGHPIPMVPVVAHEPLAYICGAWWLTRK